MHGFVEASLEFAFDQREALVENGVFDELGAGGLDYGGGGGGEDGPGDEREADSAANAAVDFGVTVGIAATEEFDVERGRSGWEVDAVASAGFEGFDVLDVREIVGAGGGVEQLGNAVGGRVERATRGGVDDGGGVGSRRGTHEERRIEGAMGERRGERRLEWRGWRGWRWNNGSVGVVWVVWVRLVRTVGIRLRGGEYLRQGLAAGESKITAWTGGGLR